MQEPKTILIGSGGHASALLEIVQNTQCANVCGIIDRPNGISSLNLPRLGSDNDLHTLIDQGITHFILGIGSVHANTNRHELYHKALDAGLQPLQLIHSSVILSLSAKIAPGCQLMPGCIIGPEASIGENSIINSGAIIEHHVKIAPNCHIASGACLTGSVHIQSNSFIGARAVIRQGITIGHNTTVGMGSVVTKDIPPHTTAYGSPAKVVNHEHKTKTQSSFGSDQQRA